MASPAKVTATTKTKKVVASPAKVTATTKTKKVVASPVQPKATAATEAKEKSLPPSAKKRKVKQISRTRRSGAKDLIPTPRGLRRFLLRIRNGGARRRAASRLSGGRCPYFAFFLSDLLRGCANARCGTHSSWASEERALRHPSSSLSCSFHSSSLIMIEKWHRSQTSSLILSSRSMRSGSNSGAASRLPTYLRLVLPKKERIRKKVKENRRDERRDETRDETRRETRRDERREEKRR